MKHRPYPKKILCVGVILFSVTLFACRLMPENPDFAFKVPSLPGELKALESKIYWKISGSLVEGKTAFSGDIIRLEKSSNSVGDWILAEPMIKPYHLKGFDQKSGIVSYGWLSGSDAGGTFLELDAAMGVGALLLRDAKNSWSGLNFCKFRTVLTGKRLDSLNVDYRRLLTAIICRDIAIYDFDQLQGINTIIELPTGTWIDGRGKMVPIEGKTDPIDLYEGINHLFRMEDGAILVVSAFIDPAGNPTASFVLHEPNRLQD